MRILGKWGQWAKVIDRRSYSYYLPKLYKLQREVWIKTISMELGTPSFLHPHPFARIARENAYFLLNDPLPIDFINALLFNPEQIHIWYSICRKILIVRQDISRGKLPDRDYCVKNGSRYVANNYVSENFLMIIILLGLDIYWFLMYYDLNRAWLII